jgi:hypothetical protein
MSLYRPVYLLLCGSLLLYAGAVAAGEPRSGYEFIMPATREMQAEDFLNPGMFTVEEGRSLFNARPDSGSGSACADCL